MKLNDKQLFLINYNYFQGMSACYSYSTYGSYLDCHEFNILYCGAPQEKKYNKANVKYESQNPEHTIEKWEEFFHHHNADFQVVIPPWLEQAYTSLLKQRGYQKKEPMPGMVMLDIEEKIKQPDLSSLNIEKVTNDQQLADFQEVVEDSYVGGLVMLQQSPDYDEWRVGFSIRYFFDQHNAIAPHKPLARSINDRPFFVP